MGAVENKNHEGSTTVVSLKLVREDGSASGIPQSDQKDISDGDITWTKTLMFSDGPWELLEPTNHYHADVHGVITVLLAYVGSDEWIVIDGGAVAPTDVGDEPR